MSFQDIRRVIRSKLHLETRQFVKNSSWVLGSNLFRQFLIFLRSIVIARGLGVEFYGLYATILAFIMTVQEILNLNIGTPFTKFGAEFKTDNRIDKLAALLKACILAALISALLSIILISILSALFYKIFFKKPGLLWFIILLAVAQACDFFDFLSTSLLRLYYKFKLNSIISIWVASVDFVVIVAAIFIFPKNLVVFMLASVIAQIVNTIICNGMVFWELRQELKPHIGVKLKILRERWMEIAKFTVNNSLSRTLWVFINRADVLLLGGLFGPIQVAYYNIGKRLANSIGVVVTPMAASIYPQMALLFSQKKIFEMNKLIRQLTKLLLVPAAIFMVVMFFVKEPLITFLYGKEFYRSAGPFYFLVLNAVMNAVFFWSLYLIMTLGMVGFRLIVYIIAIIFGGAMVFILLRFQALGMAISLFATNCMILVLFIAFAFARLKRIARQMSEMNAL